MTAQKFIKRGEEVHGPFSLDKIQSALDSGKVKSTDLISESSTGPWQSIQKFQEPLEQTPVVAVSKNAGANNPKLTTCSDCGASVSKRAETCPQCGAPLVEFEKSIDATGDPFYR